MEAEVGLRSIGKSALIYGIGLWAGRAAGFLLVPLYTRWVTMADYGSYELLSRFFDVAAAFLPLGMVLALLRFYRLAPGQEGDRAASTILLWLLGVGALGAVASVALGRPIAAALLGSSDRAHLVRLVGLWAWAEIVLSASSALLRARGQALLFLLSGIGRTASTIGASLLAVGVLRLGLEGILVANAASTGLLAVVLTVYAFRVVGISFSRTQLVAAIWFGMPLVVTTVLASLVGVADRYLLNRYMGPDQVAIYGVGTKLGMVLGMLVFSPLGMAFYPYVFANVRKAGTRTDVSRTGTYSALLGGYCALGLAACAPELIALLGPASYQAAVRPARIYLLASYLYGLSPQLEVGLYIAGATYWKIPGHGVLVLGSVVLNVLLVPRWGPAGAAAAAVGSQAAYLAVTYFVNRRFYRVNYEWSRLAKVVVALAVASAVCWLIPPIRQTLPLRSGVVLLPLVLLWVFRFFDQSEEARIRYVIGRVGLRLRRLVVAPVPQD
ncbi:MAG: lipopolysaccharide biosynthesis protein [Armatimonadota bacterium]